MQRTGASADSVNIRQNTSPHFPHVIIQKQTSSSGPDFTSNWSGWSDISSFQSINLKTTNSRDLTAMYVFRAPTTPGTAYKFRYKVVDGAGNESDWKEGADVYKLDTVNPKVENINVITTAAANDPSLSTNSRNFLAGTPGPITMTYVNTDGSPIQIEYNIERDADKSARDAKSTNRFAYQTMLPDVFTKVDDDRSANGGRLVDLQITKMTDEAGNETITPKTFNFYVFADILFAQKVDRPDVGNKIADGQENTYTQKLEDRFGNAIIPATGIGRTVTRSTNVGENTMFLNQKTRTGPTSVFLSHNGVSAYGALRWSGPVTPINLSSSNGIYSIGLKVYTPTANAYNTGDPISDPNAKFSLTSTLTVRDDQTKIKSVNEKAILAINLQNPAYKPLYTNQFVGDLQDGGFIEGVVQSSSITNTQNSNSSVAISPLLINSEFGGDSAGKFTLQSPANEVNPAVNLHASGAYWNIGNGANIDLNTILQQNSSSMSSSDKKLYLSTHFVYAIDGKSITYNGAVIGKTQYHAGLIDDIATQVGVKVIGPTATNQFHSILDGEFDNGSSILASTSVTDFRNNFRGSIAQATRNITITNLTPAQNIFNLQGSVTGGQVKNGDKTVTLVENATSPVILGDGITPVKIDGTHTLVVRGADLYIKSDMYYVNNSTLGIVVQKDANGRGGNLYIDPNVTNIIGTYILDGSIRSSSNGSTPIGVANIDMLKNQLHIFGSIVSHNTIGGSRDNPAKCPSILNISGCSAYIAQQYDLNFLRRYYLRNNKPFGDAKVIGGGRVSDLGNVTSGNPVLMSKFIKTSEDLARYPVIIEYNPNILVNTPLGFEMYHGK